MQKELREAHKDDYLIYLSKLVIILDNASVHRTEMIARFFEKSGIVAVTLPQYTPEMNPIEKFFRSVKCKISRSNLYDQ